MTLNDLRRDLDARATGLWLARVDRLELVAFFAADDLPAAVAREFADATRSVPLDRTDLGIVGSAISGRPLVSIALDLPVEAGSAIWLNRFAAERSIAVPKIRHDGSVAAVASVAVRGSLPEAEVVARVSEYLRDAVLPENANYTSRGHE